MPDHTDAWRAKYDAADRKDVEAALEKGLYSERRAAQVREWLDEKPAAKKAEPKAPEPTKAKAGE